MHLMNRYTIFTSESFLKRKDIVESKILISVIIQSNTDSCCEHMAGGVNIYFYGCVSLWVPEWLVYLCVYVCETHSKVILVLRYQG